MSGTCSLAQVAASSLNPHAAASAAGAVAAGAGGAAVADAQGRCRLLLLDNVAASVWLDRAAVISTSKQQLPLTHQQQQQPHQHGWPPQAQPPPYASMAGAAAPSPPPAAAAAAAAAAGVGGGGGGGGGSGGGGGGRLPSLAPSPGLHALRVQGALAALLHGLSQQFRFPVIATKQAGVKQLQRDGTARLSQSELLTGEWQVSSLMYGTVRYSALCSSRLVCIDDD